jgi:hypothetical protein
LKWCNYRTASNVNGIHIESFFVLGLFNIGAHQDNHSVMWMVYIMFVGIIFYLNCIDIVWPDHSVM